MVNVSVARRYARALLELASETSRLDAVGEQLASLSAAMTAHPSLGAVMRDPAYSREQRQNVVTQVMALAQVTDPSIQNLVHLLIERNRMASLPDISRVYRTLA